MDVLALTAALAAMLAYGLASIGQGYAAQRASGPAVLRHPGYLLGVAADVLAWALSLVALARLPLFVVQSILAASLAVAVLLGIPFLQLRVRPVDWIGIGLACAGLVLVSLCAGPESEVTPPVWFAGAVLGLLGVVAAVLVSGYRSGSPVLLGLASGAGFAVSALAGRVVMGGGGPVLEWSWTCAGALVRDPMVWCVLLGGGLGTVLYARALERGSFGAATALMWVVESLLPGGLGLFVLGDTIRAGWGAAAALAVALSVAGCVVLALSPTQQSGSIPSGHEAPTAR